jgi:hypothetical protein
MLKFGKGLAWATVVNPWIIINLIEPP